MPQNLVRARLENGQIVNVGPSFAKSHGLELVDDTESDATASRKAPRAENSEQGIPPAMVAAGTTSEPLTGKALTEALKQAGLSTSGKVADKQARLAEHLESQAGSDATVGVSPADAGTTIPQTPVAAGDGGTPTE